MIYKGYTGVVEIDEETGELFGNVIGLRDVITFVGMTVEAARKSFEVSVDAYLSSCQQSGKAPDEPFSGRFMVRIDPEIHQRLAVLTQIHKTTLNEIIVQALVGFLASKDQRLLDEMMATWSSIPPADKEMESRPGRRSVVIASTAASEKAAARKITDATSKRTAWKTKKASSAG